MNISILVRSIPKIMKMLRDTENLLESEPAQDTAHTSEPELTEGLFVMGMSSGIPMEEAAERIAVDLGLDSRGNQEQTQEVGQAIIRVLSRYKYVRTEAADSRGNLVVRWESE